MQCSPRKGGINLPQASSLLLLGEAEKEDKDALPSLDTFLAKHTSEDNASFEQIMEVAKEKEKVKHAWLYSAEEEYTRVGNCLGSVSALPGGHSREIPFTVFLLRLSFLGPVTALCFLVQFCFLPFCQTRTVLT